MRLSKITGYQEQDRELTLRFGEEAVAGLSFAGEDVMHLRFNCGAALQDDPDGYVVENPPEKAALDICEETGGLMVRAGRLRAVITFRPARICVYDADGRELFATKHSAMGEAEENRSVLRVALGREEGIHGLGQDPMGNVQQNGHERRMWNEWGGLHVAANAALPFYWSDRGYGLLLNSGWPSRFAVGEAKVSAPPPAHSIERSKGPWEWDTSSGEEDADDLSLILENGRMDVYVVLRSGDGAIRGYTELTGRAPLPPRWALGYMQSKNRYRTDEEFLKLGQTFREKGIPCDTLVLDWLWFKQFGDMAWDRDYWKEPEKMLEKLHEMGFHIMQAYHPFIYEDCKTLEEFRDKGYLMNTPPHTLPIFDHSNPEAREAWWEKTKKLVANGVDAYWIDMGEPRDHPQGTTCHMGSREHVHNLYSLLWAKGIYEGHVRDLKTRPFLLSRTSYAGIQRYGAALWSNDIDSSWEVLKDQVPVGLGVCASGLPYWCTDIGGFSTDERYSPEMFIRWLEWGVFCPLFRTHGTRAENEPWSYGEEANAIIERYIRLRYRLLPYIYSCARWIYESGKPMMRGLFLDYPDDPIACGQKYEYMFGPALLVAPILDRGARSREVYLPQGTWYDFWSGERITGGRSIMAQAPLDRIPLYVKSGSVIPMAECVQFVGEKPDEKITVHVYGAPGCFELYEDAGEGREYMEGAYVKTLLSWDGEQLTTRVIEGDAALIPQGRVYLVENHAQGSSEKESLLAGLTFDWDQTMDHQTFVHITGDAGLDEAVMSYELTVPDCMKLTDAPCYFRKTPLMKGKKVIRGLVNLDFALAPRRTELPVVFDATIALECTWRGKTERVEKTVTCGYGYVNTVQMLGFLEPENAADAALMARIEAGDYQNSYVLERTARQETKKQIDDGELSASAGDEAPEARTELKWNLCENTTCFGYLDMREFASKRMVGGRGTGYGRFVIISPDDRECSFEFSADRSFDLWVNGEKVYAKDGMQLKQIPDVKMKLHRGENVLLIRCFVDYPEQRSGREIGFSLRVLDENGQTARDLLYRA